MSKGIILLLIYVAWKIYGFYKKAVAENQEKVSQRSKRIPGQEEKKSIFDELLEQAERSQSEKNEVPKYESFKDTVSSEKADWVFGVDELRSSKRTHSRHVRNKKVVEEVPLSSEADEIADHFDLKTALVYSEILNAPYIEKGEY